MNSHLVWRSLGEKVEEMSAIRQEYGKAVNTGSVDRGHRSGNSTHRSYAVQRTIVRCRKDDEAIAVPRPAPAGRGVAQSLGRTAVDIDPLQLSFGKESDGATIGRPERIGGVFGTRQRLSHERIERPNPELLLTFYSLGDGQIASVG